MIQQSEAITWGKYRLYKQSRYLFVGTRRTHLTEPQLRIAILLLQVQGAVVEYDTFRTVCFEREEVDATTLRIRVNRLGTKIGGGCIKNARGRGYYLEPQ